MEILEVWKQSTGKLVVCRDFDFMPAVSRKHVGSFVTLFSLVFGFLIKFDLSSMCLIFLTSHLNCNLEICDSDIIGA